MNLTYVLYDIGVTANAYVGISQYERKLHCFYPPKLYDQIVILVCY